jgi:hypothetical protein
MDPTNPPSGSSSVESTGVYALFHSSRVPQEYIEEYWQDHFDRDTLQPRWVDIENPTMKDMERIMKEQGSMMYYVINSSGEVITELTFEKFIGRVGVIHFSMSHKIDFNCKIRIIREVTDKILNTWKIPDTDEPFLEGLMGLTPYRHSLLVVKRGGFKCLGTIPKSLKKYDGTYMDTTLVLKTRGV